MKNSLQNALCALDALERNARTESPMHRSEEHTSELQSL